MTQASHRNAERKEARDRDRFLANEIVEALRGRHPYQVVYNVAEPSEPDDGLPTPDRPPSEEVLSGGGAQFRVMGAHRGSMWGTGGYAALVVGTFFGSGVPTVYNLVLAEHDFDRLRNRLKLKGLACGLEHFYLTKKVERPLRQKACPLCELLYYPHAPFLSTPDGWRRNSRYVSERQAEVAMELFRACSVVIPAQLFSRN